MRKAKINIGEIYCKGKRQTDGSYKIVLYTGEQEIDNYQDLERLVAQNQQTVFEVRVKAKENKANVDSGREEEKSLKEQTEGRKTSHDEKTDKNDYSDLWGLIKSKAEWENKSVPEVEANLKNAWGVEESFTELEDEDLETLKADLEKQRKKHILKGEDVQSEE